MWHPVRCHSCKCSCRILRTGQANGWAVGQASFIVAMPVVKSAQAELSASILLHLLSISMSECPAILHTHTHVQFYDAGGEVPGSETTAETSNERPVDLSAAIANEVAELNERSNEIFTFHKTHVNGLLYISMAAAAGEELFLLILRAAICFL